MSDSGKKSMIIDMTEGSLIKHLMTFAAPMMAAQVLQTIYNTVDMIVIGNFDGKIGLSAVSIGGGILSLLTFLVMGLSGAGQVILSQYIGMGKQEKLNSIIGTMFTLILGCGIAVGILALAFLNPILSLLNTPSEAFAETRAYALICICGILFIYGYNLVSGILRGMGDSRHPLLFIAIASVVNLILDLIFIAGMGMGAAGAALATIIGQSVSFIWAMIYLYIHREAFGFDFALRSFVPDMPILKELVALGFPMALQSAAITVSMLFVNSMINAYGVVAAAVTGVGDKLTSIAYCVTGALSAAESTMIGQNLGAKKYDRVPKILHISLAIAIAVSAVLSLITVLFPVQVFSIFNSEADVLAMAMTYVPIAVLQFIGISLRCPYIGVINGSGNAALNLVVALLDGVICRIGFALLMGKVLNFGIMGLWLGTTLAGFAPFIIGWIYMISGRWKKPR